jgi:hypothetical protein
MMRRILEYTYGIYTTLGEATDDANNKAKDRWRVHTVIRSDDRADYRIVYEREVSTK